MVPGHGQDVSLKAVKSARIGTKIHINLLCADGIRLSMRVTVAPLEQVRPRVDFEFPGEEMQLLEARIAAERIRLTNKCTVMLQNMQRQAQRLDMKTTLSRGKQAFYSKERHDSGRAGGVSPSQPLSHVA
ncbi:MAG: hypothetical protein EOO40_08255 [Deltaproteobacteria bacterium]|nr:MAG: hypothetical protein EOO40_08255 [Deltaproteobacteria bacterium]